MVDKFDRRSYLRRCMATTLGFGALWRALGSPGRATAAEEPLPLRARWSGRLPYDAVHAAAFLPGNARIAVLSNHSLAMLDCRNGDCLSEIDLPADPFHAFRLAVSPDGRLLAVGGDDLSSKVGAPGEILVCEAGTGRRLFRTNRHDGYVAAVRFSPDGARLVTVGGTLARTWRVRDWALLGTSEVQELQGEPAVISADCGWCFYCDHTYALHDARRSFALSDKEFGSRGLAVSHDGRWLASAPGTKEVAVCDLRTRRVTLRLREHPADVIHLAFGTTRAVLAAGDQEGAVRLWDIPSGRLIARTETRGSSVEGITFSPDCTMFAVHWPASTSWGKARGALFEVPSPSR